MDVPMAISDDDPYASRRGRTFSQAEGAAPMPTPLALGVISKQMRALLWAAINQSLSSAYNGSYDREEEWSKGLLFRHLMVEHSLEDFIDSYDIHAPKLRRVIEFGSYLEIFDLVQLLLHFKTIDADEIRHALSISRAAYRLVDDCLIVPAALGEEVESLEIAFDQLEDGGLAGARVHLANAATLLTKGRAADSIRESVQAIEAVARSITGTGTFAEAMKLLKKSRHLHPALEKGFEKIYAYSSDEQGLRHPLLDTDQAKVDLFDAQFMLGACAAFISLMLNKTRGHDTV